MGHKSDGKRFKAFGDNFSTFIYVPINAISIMEIGIFILSTDMPGINWMCRLHFLSFQMIISSTLCWSFLLSPNSIKFLPIIIIVIIDLKTINLEATCLEILGKAQSQVLGGGRCSQTVPPPSWSLPGAPATASRGRRQLRARPGPETALARLRGARWSRGGVLGGILPPQSGSGVSGLAPSWRWSSAARGAGSG